MNAPTDTPVTMIIKVTDVHCLLWSHRHAVNVLLCKKLHQLHMSAPWLHGMRFSISHFGSFFLSK
jgi:hypothetical protein